MRHFAFLLPFAYAASISNEPFQECWSAWCRCLLHCVSEVNHATGTHCWQLVKMLTDSRFIRTEVLFSHQSGSRINGTTLLLLPSILFEFLHVCETQSLKHVGPIHIDVWYRFLEKVTTPPLCYFPFFHGIIDRLYAAVASSNKVLLQCLRNLGRHANDQSRRTSVRWCALIVFRRTLIRCLQPQRSHL